jgi:hypothetical protein
MLSSTPAQKAAFRARVSGLGPAPTPRTVEQITGTNARIAVVYCSVVLVVAQ